MLLLLIRMKTQLQNSAAVNARLEGEKATLQAALGAQERLLAQADQERAQLRREHEAEQAGLQSALDQERVLRVQVEDQLQGAHREHEAYVDRVRALVPG